MKYTQLPACVMLALVLASSLAVAQTSATAPAGTATTKPASAPAQPTREQLVQAAKMEQELGKLFAAKEYDKAAEKCRQQIALVPTYAGGYYNLACALARLGENDEALAALAKCVDLGYVDFDHMSKDDDLESLRDLAQFKDLLARVGENYNKALAQRAKMQEIQKKATQLAQEMMQAYKDKDYEKALGLGNQIVELLPAEAGARYNLACVLARLDKNDEAMAALTKAVELGYEEVEHMQQDEDLKPLRDMKGFGDLVAKARENEHKAGGARYEPAGEMQGVKTVEDFPDGGLRYRLRMDPNASAEKPQRLIVWLHPSGGSANSTVEAMAPMFIKNGFALVVFTQKNFMGWAAPDAAKIGKTLASIDKKVTGLEVHRPILMGFSAGGQMALQMWAGQPDKFSGLILDAAYPMEPSASGGYTPMALPDNEGIRKAPIFVLVGGQDGGAATWKQASPGWLKAGVPLTVNVIEGRKHEWLFGKEQTEALDKWLAQVAAGKFPTIEAPASKPAAQE